MIGALCCILKKTEREHFKTKEANTHWLNAYGLKVITKEIQTYVHWNSRSLILKIIIRNKVT